MLLAIDVGNTNTVFALFKELEQLGQWRLSTIRERTADEYAAALSQLMALRGYRHQDIDAVLISSVVPQANTPLRWMARDFLTCDAHVVGDDLAYPIEIRLDNPREVGADRVVNAIAARKRYKLPLVIVDFGTATTFDVVDETGAYCGGAIAAGINLSLEALAGAAAKLPRIAIEQPERAIGRNTIEAMQSGVYWGYVGLIEGLLARIAREYGKEMTVVGTGGLAPLFANGCPAITHVDSDLTMAGLLELYELNRDRVRRPVASAA